MTIEDKIKEILADPHAYGKPLLETAVLALAVKELARSLDSIAQRKRSEDGMTVRQLIALLKEGDQDANVFFEDQYGKGGTFDISGIEYDNDECTLTNAMD